MPKAVHVFPWELFLLWIIWIYTKGMQQLHSAMSFKNTHGYVKFILPWSHSSYIVNTHKYIYFLEKMSDIINHNGVAE
jgi:hypothetical protein